MSIITTLHKDESEKRIIVAQEQDVAPIIERNKRLQNEAQKSDWGRHIASIPNVIIEHWKNLDWERGNRSLEMWNEDFKRFVMRMLQDPDWRFLRTDKTWR